uniref:hydroxymethylglutaryl-CoA lyase n=1 Tax=Marinobacterium profundum TaxID=1714300 RepID=UPI00082BCD6A|nr:hydroxymethylglutaryl-CoA lyase [Marinobacterium profundum]
MTQVNDIFPRDRIVLREVGLRDGLQLVKSFPTTDDKIEWLRREHAAGVRHFEVGSFLPASRFPQFADVRAMIDATKQLLGAFASALTLNERGVEDALATGVDEIIFVVSATERHSQANTRRSRNEAVEMIRRVDAMRRSSANAPVLTVGIAMAFGCSIEGAVAQGEVLRLVDNCAEAGADVISLADTVGFAGPRDVATLSRQALALLDDKPLCLHFHDTRGMAVANAAAALDAGVRILDGSLGGLGGCPFAPGATGNIVFEDMAFLCESMGFETGIDIAALMEARAVVERSMPDEPLQGGIARAGLPKPALQAAV